MLIERKSPFTGDLNTMDLNVTQEQLYRWRHGQLAQIAFPKLTAAEREFIISGYTPEDWDNLFGGLEEKFGGAA